MQGYTLEQLYNEFYRDIAIIGNETPISIITEWFDAIVCKTTAKRSSKLPVLMISGGCGVGKSHIVQMMGQRYKFHMKISHTLDNRNMNFIQDVLKHYENIEMSIVNNDYVSVKQRNLVIFDDIDYDSGFSMSTLVEHIKRVKRNNTPLHKCVPIIIICSNPLESKFSNIFPKFVEYAGFERLHDTHIRVIYNRLIYSKFQQMYFGSNKLYLPEGNILKQIIYECNGDARHFLNQLEFRKSFNRCAVTKGGSQVLPSIMHTPGAHEEFNNPIDTTSSIEYVHNLWNIYDKTLNENLDMQSIIYIANMEPNWVINGMWENYLNKEVGFQKPRTNQLSHICEISDTFSFANGVFETTVGSHRGYDVHISQPYIQLLSIYPLKMYISNNIGNVDTSSFRFPSYFAKISNNRIIHNATINIMSKISVTTGCVYTPSAFSSIAIQPMLDLIDRLSNPIEVDNLIHELSEALLEYNITIHDLFILLRPNVFDMIDHRKQIRVTTKTLLKNIV